MKKRFISILLSLVMICSLLPVSASALVEGEEYAPLGINVYQSDADCEWTSEPDPTDSSKKIHTLTINGGGTVVVTDWTMWETSDTPRYINGRIAVNNGDEPLTLVIDNLHLYYNNQTSGGQWDQHAPLEIKGSAPVTLLLGGDNSFGVLNRVGGRGNGNGCNGIGIYTTSSLIIEDAPDENGYCGSFYTRVDKGTLTCLAGNGGAAGIGGVYSATSPFAHGDLTINSGKVTVEGSGKDGGSGGAGIGGSGYLGYSPNGGDVTINGGEVYVGSYLGAAAIGGAAGYKGTSGLVVGYGGHVAVTGGVLKAKADVGAEVPTGDSATPLAYRTGMVIGGGANVDNSFKTMSGTEYDQSFSVENAIVTLSANAAIDNDRYFPVNVLYLEDVEPYIASHIKNCVFGYEKHNPSTRLRETQDVNVYGEFTLTQDYTIGGTDIIKIPEVHNETFTVDGCTLTIEDSAALDGRTNSLILENGGSVAGGGRRPAIVNLYLPYIPAGPPADTPKDVENRALYLAVVENRSSNNKRLVSGSNSMELASKVGSDDLLTIITAGYRGFEDTGDGYKIDDANMTLSFTSNNSLSGTSIWPNAEFEIKQDGNSVTATGTNIALSSSSFAVFSPKRDTGFTIDFSDDTDMSGGKLALTAEFDPNNNNALITIPELFGSSFMLESISPVKGRSALRFGGELSLKTPVVDIAGIKITKLQLDFAGNSVTLGGIAGEGSVDIPKIGGFIGGKGKTEINTFVGEGTDEGYFMFEVEVKTPVFDGEFYLDFAEAYGVMLPNSFYMAGKVGTQGIPLVPPTTVAYITGGGLGIYDMARTIAMRRLALPPIRLRMTGSGSIVDVMEGTVDLTVGPGYTKVELSDIEIADAINVLEEVGVEYNVNLEQLKYRNVIYEVAAMHSKMYMEAGLSLMGHEFLGVDGNVGFDAYAGLSLDVSKAVRGIFRLQSSGSLGGTLKIPKGVIFGLPLWEINFADIRAAYQLAGTFHPEISTTDPMSSFTSENFLDSFSPEGVIAAKANFNVLFTSLWARVGYIFGGRPTFDGGFGEGPELLASSITPISGAGAEASPFSIAEEAADKEGDYSFMQINAKIVADTANVDGVSLMSVVGDIPAGVELKQKDDAEKVYTAKIDISKISDPKQIMYVMTAHEGHELDFDDFTITNSTGTVTRTRPAYDGNGQQTNTPNFDLDDKEADTDSTNNDKPDVAYFTASDYDTYTITCEKPIDIQAVLFAPYATLNTIGTKLDGGNAKYVIDNYDANAKYAVQVYLGEEKGGMDYLLAETPRNDNNAFVPLSNATGTIGALETTGYLAPTGSYYVTVALMEQTTAQISKGNTGNITGWVVADTWSTAGKSFGYTYTPTSTIDAPTSATLTYSGNETMTANWEATDALKGVAEGYIVTVYDSTGKSTGVTYQTVAELNNDGTIKTAAPTSVVMALTAETKDANKNIIPGLSPGNYTIGVKAFKTVKADNNPSLTAQLVSTETKSVQVTLPAAAPPKLTYSDNVTTPQDTALHSVLMNPDGGSFTVTSNVDLAGTGGFTVKSPTGVTASVTSSGKVYTVTLEFTKTGDILNFSGSGQLEILAKTANGDYAIENVTILLDDTAPTLTLNGGDFFRSSNAPANVTGRTEAEATVCAWTTSLANNTLAAATKADADGSFTLQLSSRGDFTVEAIDSAKNRSAPVTASIADGNTVTPEETSFTQYGSGLVSFTLTPMANAKLTALKCNDVAMKAGSDYVVSGNVYTLSSSFVAGLPVGGTLFTFDMSAGNAPQALLTVIPGAAPGYYSAPGYTTGSVELAGQGGAISANVKIENDVADLSFDAEKLTALLADPAVSGELSVDLTSLNKPISAAKLKETQWNAIAEAVNDPDNPKSGLALTMESGSLSLDGAAMKAASEISGDVTVSIKTPDVSKLTEQQAIMAGDRPVVDITVQLGNTPLTDLKGGSISVSIPYTLAPGENTDYLVVWYLNEAGELEPYECEYADGKLRFVLSHLSTYTAAYFPFADIPENQWYYGDVAWTYMAGLMSGVANEQFAPNLETSRAMVVTVLHRLEGAPAPDSAASFTDVDAGQWYSDAVAWASAYGIVDGYDETYFGPFNPITREQMAAILYRYEQYKGGGFTGSDSFPLSFPDAAKVSDWAYEGMCWCAKNGIINGDGAGELAPKGNAERCQVAAILHRFDVSRG